MATYGRNVECQILFLGDLKGLKSVRKIPCSIEDRRAEVPAECDGTLTKRPHTMAVWRKL